MLQKYMIMFGFVLRLLNCCRKWWIELRPANHQGLAQFASVAHIGRRCLQAKLVPSLYRSLKLLTTRLVQTLIRRALHHQCSFSTAAILVRFTGANIGGYKTTSQRAFESSNLNRDWDLLRRPWLWPVDHPTTGSIWCHCSLLIPSFTSEIHSWSRSSIGIPFRCSDIKYLVYLRLTYFSLIHFASEINWLYLIQSLRWGVSYSPIEFEGKDCF